MLPLGWTPPLPGRDALAALERVELGGYPQLHALDLLGDVPSLEVPVWLVHGRHDRNTLAELAEDWLARLEASSKRPGPRCRRSRAGGRRRRRESTTPSSRHARDASDGFSPATG